MKKRGKARARTKPTKKQKQQHEKSLWTLFVILFIASLFILSFLPVKNDITGKATQEQGIASGVWNWIVENIYEPVDTVVFGVPHDEEEEEQEEQLTEEQTQEIPTEETPIQPVQEETFQEPTYEPVQTTPEQVTETIQIPEEEIIDEVSPPPEEDKIVSLYLPKLNLASDFNFFVITLRKHYEDVTAISVDAIYVDWNIPNVIFDSENAYTIKFYDPNNNILISEKFNFPGPPLYAPPPLECYKEDGSINEVQEKTNPLCQKPPEWDHVETALVYIPFVENTAYMKIFDSNQKEVVHINLLAEEPPTII